MMTEREYRKLLKIALKFYRVWWKGKIKENPDGAKFIKSTGFTGVNTVADQLIHILDETINQGRGNSYMILAVNKNGHLAPTLTPGRFTRKYFLYILDETTKWALEAGPEWFKLEEE
jgi:hypothetical protein